MPSNLPDIDHIIEVLLTKPQKLEVRRMTSVGYGRTQAVRHLIRLGVLVVNCQDLETDLCSGTDYALRPGVRRHRPKWGDYEPR